MKSLTTLKDILDWVISKPTISRYTLAAERLENLEVSQLEKLIPLRLAFLRNFTIESMLPMLTVKGCQAGVHLQFYIGGYDNIQADVFAADSKFYQFKPDVVVVALRLELLSPCLVNQFLTLEENEVQNEINEVLRRLDEIFTAIRQHSKALTLMHNFELPLFPSMGLLDAQDSFSQTNVLRQLNLNIVDRIKEYGNAYIVDVDHMLARIGYVQSINSRDWYMAYSPYTPDALDTLSSAYLSYLRPIVGKNKKCLVLDCDNTLWGGIIGEDGLNDIHLGTAYPGSAYVAFQEAILNLYHRGIILALCSKNNEADVLEVLNEHPYMVLHLNHFAAIKVNWQDKVTNLRELAQELNIGLDSMVFVDDSQVECEWVQKQLPEVAVIQLPTNPSQYRHLIESLDLFDTLTLSQEDRQRSEMYRAEAVRQQLQKKSTSLEEYYASLEMEVKVSPVIPLTVSRVAQLTQKTNQFNLTTRRYTEGDINEFIAKPLCRLYSLELRDKFGDSGLVGVAILIRQDQHAEIDTFLLSCRVIGRGGEDILLKCLIQSAVDWGCCTLGGKYLPTTKNELVKDFYPKRGFDLVSSDEASSHWQASLQSFSFSPPNWFKKIHIDV